MQNEKLQIISDEEVRKIIDAVEFDATDEQYMTIMNWAVDAKVGEVILKAILSGDVGIASIDDDDDIRFCKPKGNTE